MNRLTDLNYDWSGTVTRDTIADVATRLRAMLAGKSFTVVWVNEFFKYEPEIRLHQRLEGGRDAKFGSGDNIFVSNEPKDTFAMITFCDNYGVWSLDTRVEKGGHHNDHRDAAYIHFKRDSEVVITHRMPSGNLCYTSYVVEGPIPASVYADWGVEPPVETAA